MKEITVQELGNLQKDSYILIDIRDEELRSFGTIPGAAAVDFDTEAELHSHIDKLPEEKTLIPYIVRQAAERESLMNLCFQKDGNTTVLEMVISDMSDI